MKSNSNKITFTYVLILLIVAVISHKIVSNYSSVSNTETLLKYSYLKDLILILFSSFVFKYILYRNDKKNKSIFKKLKTHFGIKCDFLANRFYSYLSDNTPARKIFFKEFVDKVYLTILSDDFR